MNTISMCFKFKSSLHSFFKMKSSVGFKRPCLASAGSICSSKRYVIIPSFYSWQKHLLKYEEHVFNNLNTKVVDNNCDLDSFLYEYLEFIL